jgi:hypothetical protein
MAGSNSIITSNLPKYNTASLKAKNKIITQQVNFGTPNVKYSDGRPVPKSSNDTGYIKGYEKVNKNEEKFVELNLPVETREIGENTYNTTRFQNTSEYDMDNFKYGLDSNSVSQFNFEDPTYLGFEIYIDDSNESSPFYPADAQNKVIKFLNRYSDIYEIGSRLDLFYEFRDRFFNIFNGLSSYNNVVIKNKNYYITSIKGTNLFNKKLINYPEDKITITLNEDVSMTMQYLSELYNNLIYSYKSNRYMIPEHLLRFDMHIKISEIRTFRIPNPDYRQNDGVSVSNIPHILDKRKSTIIYVLHDCNMNFFESKNSEDELTIGGFNANSLSTPATLSFDVIFKSVSKRIEPILIDKGFSIYNKESGLYNNQNQSNDDLYNQNRKSDNDLDKWNEKNIYKYTPENKEFSTSTIDHRNSLRLLNVGDIVDDAKRSIKKGAMELTKQIKDTIVRNLKEKRNDLINRFISQVDKATSLRNINDLGNVYDGDSHVSQSILQKMKRDIINDLEHTRKELITEGKLAITEYILNFDKKLKI